MFDRNGTAARATALLAYPLIVFGWPLAALLAYRATGNLALASALGTTLAALSSVVFENLIAFRDDWRALDGAQAKKNTRLNLLYVASSALCQELSAKQVVYAALVPFFAWLGPQTGLGGWWPQGWPMAAQVVLLLVFSDFLQYWTHRVMHEWGPAWAMHKVHHSLESLNWSAVGRMHPLEHVVASGSRLLPVIASGVGPEVVLVYLTFLNCQGFAVHTNIRFDTRLLNRLLYTPDHHRFHHSQVIAQSNTNYAGPLLLWDAVFRTLYLPDTAGPQHLGLLVEDGMRRDQDREPSVLRLFARQCLAPLKTWAGRDPAGEVAPGPAAAD